MLGQRFSITLLGAGRAGFGVLITALGCGVGLGMLALAIGGTLRGRREVLFSASLIATGAAITASATTSSVIPAAAWLFVGGLGAGGSYVMGFTYLHEEVEDELRGRTFAALYTVVRTSLLASVTLAGLAVPLLDGLLNPPLDSGLRLTLLAGGIIVFAAGITTLWAVRMTPTPQAHRDWIQGVARGGRRLHLDQGQAPHSGRQLMVSMAGEGSAGAEPAR